MVIQWSPPGSESVVDGRHRVCRSSCDLLRFHSRSGDMRQIGARSRWYKDECSAVTRNGRTVRGDWRSHPPRFHAVHSDEVWFAMALRSKRVPVSIRWRLR